MCERVLQPILLPLVSDKYNESFREYDRKAFGSMHAPVRGAGSMGLFSEPCMLNSYIGGKRGFEGPFCFHWLSQKVLEGAHTAATQEQSTRPAWSVQLSG